MSKSLGLLITLIFGFVSVHSLAVKFRSAGLDDALYAEYICADHPNGARIMVPGTCTKYFECQSGKSVLKTCANPTKFFDSSSGKCVATSNCIEPKGDCSTPKPKPKPPCSNNKTTTVTTTVNTTPTTLTTTPRPSSTTPTSTKTTQTEPTTSKPTTPHKTPCEIKREDREREQLQELENYYADVFAAPGARCDSLGGSCRSLSNGAMVPYKNKCDMYLYCVNGCGAEFSCSIGLHYNQAIQNCDIPENAKCSFK